MPESPVEPLVSVVVPVFDVVHYLTTCVESILGQSYPHLEVLLVDDGSTDGSGGLCDRFVRRDPRVRVLHQENRGVSVARNAGIAASTGSYVTFVDSDDWLAQTFVARALSLLAESDADVAVCHHTRVPDDASPGETATSSGSDTVRVLTPDEALLEFLGHDHLLMTVAWGKLFRRNVLAGVEFPAGVKHEDEFVLYRLLHRARRTVVTAEGLYFYRQRPGSIMTTEFGIGSRLDRLAAFRERAEYLSRAGLGNVGYRPVLDEQLALWSAVAEMADENFRRRFTTDLEESVRRLRRTPQPLAFRTLAEAYLVAPRFADCVYHAYLRRRP